MTELIAHTQHHGKPLGDAPSAATETGTQGHPAEREGVASPEQFPESVPGPFRVQLSRAKGWRMPPNTVKVDRTTRWGNPFRAEDAREAGYADGQRMAVEAFRSWLAGDNWACGSDKFEARRFAIKAALGELRGKNLACWCKPGAPCHADVLLELANGEEA